MKIKDLRGVIITDVRIRRYDEDVYVGGMLSLPHRLDEEEVNLIIYDFKPGYIRIFLKELEDL